MTGEMWIMAGIHALLAIGLVVVMVALVLLYKRWADERFDGPE